jgi:hypothetical protein
MTVAMLGEIETLTAFAGAGNIVTVAEANFVGSTEETAVTVTVLPVEVAERAVLAAAVVGTEEGAV